MLDSTALLAFGFLAEEFIRDDLERYLMPGPRIRRTLKTDAIPEFEGSKIDPGEYKKWKKYAKSPPNPPYLKGEEDDGEDYDAAEEDKKKGTLIDSESSCGEKGTSDPDESSKVDKEKGMAGLSTDAESSEEPEHELGDAMTEDLEEDDGLSGRKLDEQLTLSRATGEDEGG